jgi:MATE family multidrug resistance protein
MSSTAVPSVSARIQSELGPMLSLAWPVIVAELGWMAMGVVDTLMVGRIGAEAIGAVAVGNAIFNILGLLIIGILLGLDTLISQAFGAGDLKSCHHSFRQGFWLGGFASVPLIVGVQAMAATLGPWGLDSRVAQLAEPYIWVVSWSIFPLAIYSTFRRYLQSTNRVRPIMFALVSANLVNVFFNWVLIHGNLGAPAMGVEGSAWSTVLSRIYMALVLVAPIEPGVLRFEPPDWQRIAMLVRLGLPAAGHILLEVGVFAAATLLAGRFPPAALAAHEIALHNAAITYMVPLGISAAASVRVGQAIGRGQRAEARIAGWTAILLGAGFMALSGLTMLAIPGAILRLYTDDVQVLGIGIPLLYAAAAFQLFDGTQVVSTGALRGLGDTKSPFFAGVLGYWILGLPLGAWLCFWLGWGVMGLWIGFIAGLMTVAVIVLRRWAKLSRAA